jgi:predicted nucleotidyltransferase
MNISLTSELEKYVRALLEREGEPARTLSKKAPKKDEILAKLATLEKPLRERGLKSLAVFGSVARGAARTDSDVDVLVDIEPDVRFSLIDLVALKDFLEDRLNRKVDVVTKSGLDSGIRDRVLSEAESVF